MDGPLTRRELLRSGTVGAGLLVAGCTSAAERQGGTGGPESDEDATGEPDPTQNTTRGSFTTDCECQNYDFTFDARLRNQATSSTPPRFRAELTNDNEFFVDVYYGQSFMYTDPGVAGNHDAPAEFVVVPDGEDALWSPTDGCWLYAPESSRTPTIRSVRRKERIEPGESIGATYAVYSSGTADRCYPEGEYVYEDGVNIDSERPEWWMPLSVRMTVDGSGAFAVSPVEPKPEP